MANNIALVTGASAGLGVAFAHALAAERRGLVLTARRTERLETLATELRARHGVAVTVLPADLADADAAKRLIAAIREHGLTVDTLINNAGFGLHGAFAGQDAVAIGRMIDLNCRALVQLAHAVLPDMLAARNGAILNLASVASFQPGPWFAVYAATKAFVLSFSEALHEEVRGNGVRVTALCPGPTRTEFGAVSGMGDMPAFDRFGMDAAPVVRAGLDALRRGQAVRVPGWSNRLMTLSGRVVPRALLRRAVAGVQKRRS